MGSRGSGVGKAKKTVPTKIKGGVKFQIELERRNPTDQKRKNEATKNKISSLKSKDFKAAGASFTANGKTATIKKAYKGKNFTYTVTSGKDSKTGLDFKTAKKSLNDMLGL